MNDKMVDIHVDGNLPRKRQDVEAWSNKLAEALREELRISQLLGGETVTLELSYKDEGARPRLREECVSRVLRLLGKNSVDETGEIHVRFYRSQPKETSRLIIDFPLAGVKYLVRDPVHKDIELTPWEQEIISTKEMQRLHGIKQLGMAYHAFPAAVHTRFEHSLGTCWMAKKIISVLEEKGFRLTSHEKEIIAATALVHDVTHIPFGHTFEDERLVFSRHDSEHRMSHFIEKGELGRVLKNHKDEVLSILRMDPKYPKPYHSQIIANTVCADLLDYLKRDSFFTGLSQNYDERIFSYFSLDDDNLILDLSKHGVQRLDAMSEIANLLRMRYTLAERVIYHHTKLAFGTILAEAVERVKEKDGLEEETYYDMTDDLFMDFLLNPNLKKSHSSGVARVLAQRAFKRRLYKRAYLLTKDSFEKRAGFNAFLSKWHYSTNIRDGYKEHDRRIAQKEIAASIGLNDYDVLIYCPDGDMLFKEAQALVKLSSRPVIPLSEAGMPEINLLKTKYESLWKLWVFVHTDDRRVIEKVSKLCEKEIFKKPNEFDFGTRQ